MSVGSIRRKCLAIPAALVAVFAVAAVSAAPALASGKPLLETKPATSINSNGATLNSVVNPNNLETKYDYEYGTTEAYGSKTAELTTPAGITNIEPSAVLTGLTLNTKYDFRIVATNSAGTIHGENMAFSTPATSKPSVESVWATKTTETTATLTGKVNPETAETKYHFEYGTTESYGKSTAEASAGSGTKAVEVTASLTGLTKSTTYYFRLVATNAHGTTEVVGQKFFSAVGPEFNPVPTAKKFTGSGGESRWAWSGGVTIACSAGSTTGEIAGPRTIGHVIIVFTGCKSSDSGHSNCPINTVGAKAEEIVTQSLAGELGTATTSKEVGLRLKAETGTKWFTTIGTECGSPEAQWTGSLAGVVSPIGKKQTTGKLHFVSPNISEFTLDSGTIEKPRLSSFHPAADTVNIEGNWGSLICV
jgi:hypothetical protein